ncbi:MAG: hypothetical protein QNJ53_20200 [Pleurocapsa sp. MO_192.B19]|nr:hypothetical protein [Pleurocapsa sp. MO_192.B19]
MTMLQVTDLKPDGYVVDLDQWRQVEIQGGGSIFDAVQEIGLENIRIDYVDLGDTFLFNITNVDDAVQYNSVQEG